MKFTIETTTTLFDFACKVFPDSSKTSVKAWITAGRFIVDGESKYDVRLTLKPRQKVEFVAKPPHRGEPFIFAYEDDDVVVVDKPGGLLSVAKDIGEEKSVHSLLKERYKKPVFVVHRLDKETSGLILFARTYDAYVKLKEDLKERKMKRVYEAIVEGYLEGYGIWEGYLKEEGASRVRFSEDPKFDYEHSVTEYKVLKSSAKFSRIECTLQTGKRHQIRVHAQNAGHPIAGDSRYSQHKLVPRLCLHAKELIWTHPKTGKLIKCTSKTPRIFDRLVGLSKRD